MGIFRRTGLQADLEMQKGPEAHPTKHDDALRHDAAGDNRYKAWPWFHTT